MVIVARLLIAFGIPRFFQTENKIHGNDGLSDDPLHTHFSSDKKVPTIVSLSFRCWKNGILP